MATERKWSAVTQTFTADGTSTGVIKVSTTRRFKVKAKIILQSNTQPEKEYEIKSVPDCFTIEVGPFSKDMDERSDVSMYLLADLAKIKQPKQKRPPIGPGEIDRAVYEEEPTVARRVFIVDDCGTGYSVDHPFPVQLSDGSINIGSVNAELEVQLSAKDNDPDVGDVHDSVRIGDGTEELAINPDGSINVNITDTTTLTPIYSDSGNVDVTSGAFQEIFSYTSSDNTTRIFNIESTCSTPGLFRVKLDGSVIRELRSSPTERNVKFAFSDGRPLQSGKQITLEVQVDRFLLSKYIAFTSLEGGKT